LTQDLTKAFGELTDWAADKLSAEIKSLRHKAEQERQLRDAQLSEALSGLEVQKGLLAEAVARLDERVATIKDGIDGVDGKDAVAATANEVAELLKPEVLRTAQDIIAAFPVPKDGLDAIAPTAAEVAELLLPEVTKHAESVLLFWEKPQDGKDADMDVLRAHLDELVSAIPVPKDGEPGIEGPPGKLPMVYAWEDKVYFEGEVVTRDGSVFQANRATGKQPDHEDWNCIVKGGANGDPGKSPEPKGLFDSETDYSFLDIVMLNGASFIAKYDGPGACPGEGWNLLAGQGKQGRPGPPGLKGEPGRASLSTVKSMDISEDGLLVLANSDGTIVECDLYPVLSKVV
jgi:hypothetical protein